MTKPTAATTSTQAGIKNRFLISFFLSLFQSYNTEFVSLHHSVFEYIAHLFVEVNRSQRGANLGTPDPAEVFIRFHSFHDLSAHAFPLVVRKDKNRCQIAFLDAASVAGDSAAADDAYSDFSSHIVSPIVFKIYYIPFSVLISPVLETFQKSKPPLRKEKRPKRRRDCFEQAAIFQKC